MNSVTQYLASIGRKGGKAKTSAKSAAAKANGKLGGRPKKPKRDARRHNNKLRHSAPAEDSDNTKNI